MRVYGHTKQGAGFGTEMAVQIGFPRGDSIQRMSGRECGHGLRQAGG